MASVSLKGICKSYGKNEIVKSVDLEIDHGEFVVLVGPSGCGKSTMLNMIAGLETITEGDLFIGELRVNDVEPKERNIAMVFQDYALYPHMTIYKNMAFGLIMRKFQKSEIERRVHEAASILGITNLLNRKPKELSGGQRQRVALGRAMVREPAVFLLDEPLSNLDAKLRTSMRSELIKLHQRLGTTFVYVTHDQTEAMTMGSKIVVMKDGVMQQVGVPQFLYEKPCNMFVAGFIGNPQMNFISGILREKDTSYYVQLVNDNHIPIHPTKATKDFAAHTGVAVKVGIRPEIIFDDAENLDKYKDSILSAKVDVVERLGGEAYLHLDYSGEHITACVPSNTTAKVGQTIRVAVNCEKIHLFDAKTEAAITN